MPAIARFHRWLFAWLNLRRLGAPGAVGEVPDKRRPKADGSASP